MKIYKVMTIAGSDSSGGAGIQADLKTFTAFGTYGMSAITALTAQNTLGVQNIQDIPPEFVQKQIESIMTDIGVDAAKTGMLAKEATVKIVAESINKFKIPNVVVDPVMVAKSGDLLLSLEAREAMMKFLLPVAMVITPNIYEAESILNCKIRTLQDMELAAVEIKKMGSKIVVLKGGHLEIDGEAVDLVYDGNKFDYLKSPYFQTKNTHGTGCTFASAIAAGLARQLSPRQAILKAKEYISAAISKGISIGEGHGPTNHLTGIQTIW